jgi:Cytochrome c554 and c-prime
MSRQPLSSAAISRWLVFACCTARLACSADYVGAESCAECHRTNFEKQSASHHAHSLRKIAESPLAAKLLTAGRSPDGTLRYEQDGDSVAVIESGSAERAVIEWAFGAGAQGSTPVGHVGDQYFEHRFSFYARLDGLAPTFGHPAHVTTPIAKLGLLQDNHTITHCFSCHATGVEQGTEGPELRRMRPGVQCERCHGPGSAHIAAAKQGSATAAVIREIVNPGRFSAKAQIEICGQCHRLATPGTGDEPELESPVTVRFAPISLMASRCFRASGKIACLTCHDPHADALPRSDFSYSEKCLACHGRDGAPVKACRRLKRENCLPCHMKQASLGPYLRFTDHRIRVY